MESDTKGSRQNKLIVVLAITLVAVTLASAFVMTNLRNTEKQVQVIDNGQNVEVTTTKKTVEELINSLQIELKPGDLVIPAMSAELDNGTTVKIIRSKQIQITADGETFRIYSTKNTVSEVLEDAGVQLGEMDKINKPLDSKVFDGCNLEIIRVTQKELKEYQPVEYKVVVKKNTTMDKGDTRVIQQGQEGKVEKKYLATYENGVEVDRQLIAEQIIQEPVDRIVEEGTIESFYTSRGEKVRYNKVLTMSATAYTASSASADKGPGDSGYGITSTGAKATCGVVAVDPRVIPLGTRLYIEGYGFAVAADTGGAIKGNRIDLCMDSISQAMAFGRRTVKVYILAK